ncbi:replication-relaxation family protein [Cytobacillus sp. FSL H8-0458]|uniref:replication-relaxation family protein n=1 Tax=Cytobacillus sp. FSL H8-0458 TaxID=2975346 RepID=UPI0030F92736
MRKRDMDILYSLEKFKCLERDQIAALHFSNNKNPIVSVNRVLKRLRMDGYVLVNTNRSFKPYIYFYNPSPIKLDSQKIDHYLMIAQGYIDMSKYSKIEDYKIEPNIEQADFIPDVACKWLGNEWFLEFQNSTYTVKQLYAKLDRYKEYHDKGYWNNQRVLIIGKTNLKLDAEDYPFKVKQIRGIEDLSETIQQFKEMKYREFKGKVKEEADATVSKPSTVSEGYKSKDGVIKFVF